MKLIVSLSGGIVAGVIWWYTFFFGLVSLAWVWGIISAGERFSKSRGSLLDLMQYNSTMNNPLKNIELRPDDLVLPLMLAVVFAGVVVFRGVKASSVLETCGIELRLISGAIMSATMISALMHWIIVKDTDVAIRWAVIGIPLAVVLSIISDKMMGSKAVQKKMKQPLEDISSDTMAWFVSIYQNEQHIRSEPLVNGSYVVGRDAQSDILIDDPGVSRRHLRIDAQVNGDIKIVDLDSSGGTWKEGKRRITRMTVHDNDWFLIGNTQLLFHTEGELNHG